MLARMRVVAIFLVAFSVLADNKLSAKAFANHVGGKLVRTNDISHATSTYPSSGLSPIILLPGDGGSRLQAKLDRQDVAHHYCERKSNNWFDLWLNLSLLVPFALDCWVDK